MLLGQVLLKRARLFNVKQLEVAMLSINLESIQGLRRCVDGRLTVTLRLLQIAEIFALYPFVFRVVFCHDRCLLSQVTVYGGLIPIV